MFLIVANFIMMSLIFINKTTKYVDSIIKSAVIMGGLIVGYNEIASVFHSLNDVTCLGFWGIILMSMVLYVNKNKIMLMLPKPNSNDFAEYKNTPILIAITVFFALIAIVTLFTALYYPPNTSDSMVYHMPKVMQWIQNQSVMHFPTNSIRQLYLAPYAEYIILHFQLLSNSDYLANLAQWFSFIGCALLSFELVKVLGGNLKAQFFALILTVTIPMAVLQSTSTQTDLVASFLIISSIYFILKIFEEKKFTNILFLSISIGLAILTKGTAYFFLLPFILILGFKLIKEKDFKSILTIILIVSTINIGHWVRNYSLFHTFLVPKSHAIHYQIETLKPNYILVNFIRNLTLNTAIPNNAMTNLQLNSIKHLEKALGVETNSNLTTFPNSEFALYPATTNELTTGNIVHFAFFIIFAFLLPLIPALKNNRKLIIYLGCGILGLLLFSTILKWQPWGARLNLPFFIIITPYLAMFLTQIKPKFFANFIIALFIFFTASPLLLNSIRPISIPEVYNSDRYVKLFHNRWTHLEKYKNINAGLYDIKPRKIGIIGGDDSYEYPIWFFVKNSKVRIQHQNIENESKILLDKNPFKSFRPDIIIDLR